MADPLSLTASIIAVTTLATGITSTISKLRALYELPARLDAINNEVTDLEVVLYQVMILDQERRLIVQSQQPDEIKRILNAATTKLQQLEAIIQRLTRAHNGGRKFVSRAAIWFVEKSRLAATQQEIQSLKANLVIMLGVINSQDITRVQLELRSISLVSSSTAEKHIVLGEDLKAAMQLNQSHMNQRLDDMEKRLYEQFLRLQISQTAKIGSGSAHSTRTPYASSGNKPTSLVQHNHPVAARFDGISIRSTQRMGRLCPRPCACICHRWNNVRSPSALGPVFGLLFVGYAGIPGIQPECDDEGCMRRQAPIVSIEYWFPIWFLAQVMRILLGYQPGSGPQMQLQTIRLIPDDSPGVAFAFNGDIAGLKHLFTQGLASPVDVSKTRQYSLLRWAVSGSQYKTCKFLLEAGADPHQSDSSERLWDFTLQGELTDEEQDTVRSLLNQSDYIEDHEFPVVHKIVLQLSLRSLEDELISNPLSVYDVDIEGRTALHWAAARRDERSVITLLNHGADPNAFCKVGRTALYLAADRNPSARCIRLLLDAGARADPIVLQGMPHRSSPLITAATWSSHPLAVKVLLDGGANTEAQSVDGSTALIATARRGCAATALALMEHNANLDAQTKNGLTPLTSAITYNNHGVLQVLLDHWHRYQSCPRLAAPGLLSIVAEFADVRSIEIFASAEHLRLYPSKRYELADKAIAKFKQRVNVTEKLKQAFDDMLYKICENPYQVDSVNSPETDSMESSTDSLSSNEVVEIYEDALEIVCAEE